MDLRKHVRRILMENSGEIPYKTPVTDVDVDNFKTDNPDEYVSDASMTVTWRVEFEGRTIGIKSIIIVVDSIEGVIKTTIPKDTTDESREIPFTYSSIDSHWQVITEKTSTDSIIPKFMEIDYTANTIKIEF